MRSKPPTDSRIRDVIIIGGGLAGLSAAVYLGRAKRDTLVIDSGKSMARWEPEVQNYLGFPDGISGEELVRRGRRQAERFEVEFVADEILGAEREDELFLLRGAAVSFKARRLLLATGIFHIPPEINGVAECLGRSMFFCKDCDGIVSMARAWPSMAGATRLWNTRSRCWRTRRSCWS